MSVTFSPFFGSANQCSATHSFNVCNANARSMLAALGLPCDGTLDFDFKPNPRYCELARERIAYFEAEAARRGPIGYGRSFSPWTGGTERYESAEHDISPGIGALDYGKLLTLMQYVLDHEGTHMQGTYEGIRLT